MRLIDADTIEFTRSENGCAEDYVTRYDINEMPTIESPRHDWTPCAEGMPKDSKPVLVTVSDSAGGTYVMTECYHCIDQYWFDQVGDEFEFPVLAWMPKPEPYNPDRKEDAKCQE